MAAIKDFDGFEKKEDILELVDKFDKSSLFELDISIVIPTHPVEKKIEIKMVKLAGMENDYWNNRIDTDNSADDGKNKKTLVKISKNPETESPAVSEAGGTVIKAPLVGTFYISASPEAEPYVKVGDKITQGKIVCIIEAMKTMNEIESDSDGEIAAVLVKNGSAVEYGQPLFRLK